MGDLVAGSITVSRAVLADLTSAAAQVFNHIGTGRYTRGQVHDLLRGPVDRAQAALDAAALRQEPSVDEGGAVLTSDQCARLRGVVYKTLERHGADYQVLSVFGSMFDTLPVDEVVALADDWLSSGETLRAMQ